ncbi:MAG: DUF72 domain-containing protein [Brevinematales bacterium]|nr:DUF72 domain-containing protein [Brevinematales bacterium]
MEKTILVGTSGWSYDDWINRFYPQGINKNKFLTFYSTKFNTVEINFSYYRIPNKYILNSIQKNVPNNFIFTAKLHSIFTHQKEFTTPYQEIPMRERDEFLTAFDNMRSKGMIDTFLAQFPQSFHFSNRNLEYVVKLAKAFQYYNIAVEFRSKEWYNKLVFEILSEENITFVSVDEPNISNLPPREFILTNKIGYIRLHSRDSTKWYEGEKSRYDYFYSDDELLEWIEKIKTNQNFEKIYVFFNNCHNGQAAENALRFKEMLSYC